MISRLANLLRYAFLLALLSLSLAIQPACAESSAKPKPGRWRVMTLDDATSTSNCIGDPRTPLCALDTFYACWFRRDIEMCLTAWNYPREKSLTFHLGRRPDPGQFIEFRVVRTHRVRASEIDADVGAFAKVDDIELTVADRTCGPPKGECIHDLKYPGYFVRVRFEDDRWRVTDYVRRGYQEERWPPVRRWN